MYINFYIYKVLKFGYFYMLSKGIFGILVIFDDVIIYSEYVSVMFCGGLFLIYCCIIWILLKFSLLEFFFIVICVKF